MQEREREKERMKGSFFFFFLKQRVQELLKAILEVSSAITIERRKESERREGLDCKCVTDCYLQGEKESVEVVCRRCEPSINPRFFKTRNRTPVYMYMHIYTQTVSRANVHSLDWHKCET